MNLWIGNGAVLKSSSQWQLEKKLKKKKKIVHGRNYLIFKLLLIAIDWNLKELHYYLSIKSQ